MAVSCTRNHCVRAVKAMSNGKEAETAVFEALTQGLEGYQPFKNIGKWRHAKCPTNSIILHRPLGPQEKLYRRANRNDIKIIRADLPDIDVEVQHMDKKGTIENKIGMTILDTINAPPETVNNINILVLTGNGFGLERRQSWRDYCQQKGGKLHIMSLNTLKHHCTTGFQELPTL